MSEVLVPFVEAGRRAIEVGQDVENRLKKSQEAQRFIGRAAIAMALVASAFAGSKTEVPEKALTAAQCVDVQCMGDLFDIQFALGTDGLGALNSVESRSPAKPEKARYILSKEYHRVERNIDAMDLSAEGYLKYLDSINTKYLREAQRTPAFNPSIFNRNGGGIRQVQDPRLETVIFHYTADLYDWSKGEKAGVLRILKGMNKRNGDPNNPIPNVTDSCCAFHELATNRVNGKSQAIVFAPHNYRLAHAGVLNPRTYGIEAESSNQAIDTEVLETMVYSAVRVLQQAGTLDPKKVNTQFQGHGEMFDRIYPDNLRSDFDFEVMDYLRRTKIKPFLKKNPSLLLIKPQIPQLNLGRK